jgi:carbon starvation protein
MAQIFSSVLGGRALMGFWYHFAILFEALFILTAVDAGTRACRFMVQDMIGSVVPAFRRTQSVPANLVATAVAVSMWGYILYGGVVDPLGGINSLWPLFGISNQMLAGVALILCTVVLFKMKRQRYAWVSMVPAAWLLVCTVTAGLQKVFAADPAIGFLSHARKFGAAVEAGVVLAPAKSMAEMNRIVFNDYVDAALAFAFVMVVVSVLAYGIVAVRRALTTPTATAVEVGEGMRHA